MIVKKFFSKINKKIAIISSSSLCLLIFVIVLYNGILKKEVPIENNIKLRSGSTVSVMIETSVESGEYKQSDDTKWPTDGYVFNETLSKCENGGTLSWDDTTHSVILKTSLSDRCYAYFDFVPPDITIAVNNLPTSLNSKLGSITCNNSTATYNQRYSRIEVSQVSGKYTNCTLNYTDSTSKVNLASYITSLAGTTQGTGEVVSETFKIPDYTNATAISESAYTNQSIFSSTSTTSTSGTSVSGMYTFSGTEWTSAASSMTSNTSYHFKFTPSEDGMYELCYNLSSGSTYNRLYAYVNSAQESYVSASSSEAQTGCIDLGYVTTSDYIKVVQYAYTTISTLTFSIKKGTYTTQNAGIRYEGKNPNNYIWFNNEYWRLIGVFDSNTHGQNGKNLVKIIRAETLDGLVWNKSNTNDWAAASLNSLLNSAYYNATDGTSSGYCYGYSTTVAGNCDYTKRGIQDGYRSMVANVTWYLGGHSSNYTTAKDFYIYERGTTVYSGRPTSTTGYIGLMYPSDYGYSVLSSSCARTTYLSSYYSSSCAGASWIIGAGEEWLLMPFSLTSYHVFFITEGSVYDIDQDFTSGNAENGAVVRPVLYLDSTVYKVDGDGSLDNPYIIGM